MLAKKMKATIKKDRKLTIHVPDLPPGEVEIIILREEEKIKGTNGIKLIPRHHAGKIYSSLKRDDIYGGAR